MAIETLGQTYLKWSSKGVDTKLMLVPLTICMFMLVLSVDIKSSAAFVWMRKLSLMMFLSQRIFLTLFSWFLSDTMFVQNSLVNFVSVLLLTLTFSFGFIKLSDKVKVLKKFY